MPTRVPARLRMATSSELAALSSAALVGAGGFPRVSALLSPTVSGVGATVNASFTTNLAVFGGSSTIVELSGVGQVLSAAAAFESRLSALRPGETVSGLGPNFGTDFASLAAEAQAFVDAFNTAQRGLLGGGSGLGSLTGLQLAAPVVTGLVEQVGARFETGNADLTRLSDLGIDFRPPVPGAAGAALEIDLDRLRAAFDADPAASFSLLAQSVRSFESLAGDFTASTGGLSAGVDNAIRTLVATQAFAGLFGGNSALQGLPGLLLLDSLSGGGTRPTQQLAALSQFALVSSLLG